MNGRRKLLREMTPAELQTWLLEQRSGLEEFCSYAQMWTKRRAKRGKHNHNDERYEQFYIQAADLIAGLDEMRAASQEEPKP